MTTTVIRARQRFRIHEEYLLGPWSRSSVEKDTIKDTQWVKHVILQLSEKKHFLKALFNQDRKFETVFSHRSYRGLAKR